MSDSQSGIHTSDAMDEILELESILVSEGKKKNTVRPDPDVGH